MKNNLSRVAAAVFDAPWLVLPSHHAVIRSIVNAHITGQAHTAEGIVAQFRAQEQPDKKQGAKNYDMIGSTAVIPVVGTLGLRVGEFAEMSGMTDYLNVQRRLTEARDDDDVDSIILAFDSPGGTCTGCPETADIVSRMTKPCVAYTDSGMFSAAYWIGAQADVIVASESSGVGSIGVYSYLLDVSRMYENAGIEAVMVKSGKYKGMGAEGIAVTDEQKALLQADVDAIFSDFRDAVKYNRPDVGDDAMQGQTFLSGPALAAGLIDHIGGIEVAINEARLLVAKNRGEL